MRFEHGRYAQAADAFRAVLAEEPNDARLHALLGSACSMLRKGAPAMDAAGQAVALEPDPGDGWAAPFTNDVSVLLPAQSSAPRLMIYFGCAAAVGAAGLALYILDLDAVVAVSAVIFLAIVYSAGCLFSISVCGNDEREDAGA